jgi:hypothetical protein
MSERIIRVEEEYEACESCGRYFADFNHHKFRRRYKCSRCKRIVCCMCFYEHMCGRRLCRKCLSEIGWRKTTCKKIIGEHGAWRVTYDTYEIELFEHTWGTSSCGECNRTDNWYRVSDMISLNSTWKGIYDLSTY